MYVAGHSKIIIAPHYFLMRFITPQDFTKPTKQSITPTSVRCILDETYFYSESGMSDQHGGLNHKPTSEQQDTQQNSAMIDGNNDFDLLMAMNRKRMTDNDDPLELQGETNNKRFRFPDFHSGDSQHGMGQRSNSMENNQFVSEPDCRLP